MKYGFNETASPQWYAKCGELINDKQGFYPYFVMLLSQQYEKARDLLFNQASYGMDAVSESEKDYESPVVPTTPSLSTGGYKSEHDRLVAHIQAANPHLQKDNAADVAKKSNLMRCPICHNQISHDVDECPFCHQRLDKNSSPQDNTTDTDSNTNRKNHIGEVLFFSVCLVLLLLIIGFNFCDNNNRYESSSVDLSDSVSFSEAHSYLYDNPAENTKSADDAAAIDDDASLPKDDYEQESYEVVPDLDEVLEESVSFEEIQEIFE